MLKNQQHAKFLASKLLPVKRFKRGLKTTLARAAIRAKVINLHPLLGREN
jgi:hypothetical protein